MKFNRRILFGLIATIFYGILTKYSQKSAVSQENSTANSETISGIDPKPQKPKIINIQPNTVIELNQDVPQINFLDDTVPKQWLYKTPVTQGEGQKLVNLFQDHRLNLETFQQLPQDKLIANSWPDFTEAIDLKALGNDQPEISSLFYTTIIFDKSQLLRVCHGVAGLNVKAQMWLNQIPIKHGELIQVNPGAYPIIMEVYHGEKTQWLSWNLARLAPRFTIITHAEIEAVYQWQLSQWEETINMAKNDDDRLLNSVKFKPETIRGKEGFFRVGRSIYDKWWFIDPQGKAFYHIGCTGLNAGGSGGRRANLPAVSKPIVKTWVAYLKEWGFNAMGAWTTAEFFYQNMAFTEIIETYYEKPWLINKFPDVWNPEWSKNVDQKCQKLCTPLKDNKMLLGYFLDNERGFMDVLGQGESIIANAPIYRHKGFQNNNQLELPAEPKLNPKGIGLLQFCLSQGQEIPAFQKAWEFILNRYDTLENLSQAWQIEIASENTIRLLTIREEILISPTYLKDNSDFVKQWVEQYYRVCISAIRNYDPNHLILGCRWGHTPSPAVIDVEKEWSDVVSRNNYRANFYELFDQFYQAVNRPILNGELSTWTDDYTLIRNPIEPPGGYDIATRQKLKSRDALDRIFSHPGILGYTKYRWHGKRDKLWNDQPKYEIINPLRQANYRAVSIATVWDSSPQLDHDLLQGQIFLTLLDGTVTIQELPAARVEDQASYKISKGYLTIGLVSNDDQWDKKVYGNGIKGEVIESNTKGNNYQLSIELQTFPTLLTTSNVTAKYTILLIRNRSKLEGEFTGIYDNNNVSGRAIAYVHRPVSTVRY